MVIIARFPYTDRKQHYIQTCPEEDYEHVQIRFRLHENKLFSDKHRKKTFL